MAQCSEISLLLGAFEDGELEPNEMQEVARHLARCEGCERTLADYSRLGRLLRNETVLPPLDGFGDAVLSRIEHLQPPLTIRLNRWREGVREFFGPGLGLATAAAVATLATVLIVTPLARKLMRTGGGGQTTQLAAANVGSAAAPPMKAVEAAEAVGSGMPSAATQAMPAMAVTSSTQAMPATSATQAMPATSSTLAATSIAPTTIISRLETSNPDVAVWSEPHHGTTVIWLPDQP